MFCRPQPLTQGAVSGNGDNANVRMILPSFIHTDDRTHVQLSELPRRL